jgi:hypothetical protein
MTQWYNYLLLYLWIAPHVILLAVAIFLLKRRLFAAFPMFVLYTWYEIAGFLLLFTIAVTRLNHGSWYLHTYLVTLAISTALRFGVIQEIFNHIFREHGPVDALARTSLRWITVALLLVAVGCAILSSPQSFGNLFAGAAWIGRGIAIIQCGLLLFLFLFSSLFGIALQSYVFGIALGFGILSSVELVQWAMSTADLSLSTGRALNLLPTAGYHVAVVLWLTYLLVPAKQVLQPLITPAQSSGAGIDGWNSELERFLQ